MKQTVIHRGGEGRGGEGLLRRSISRHLKNSDNFLDIQTDRQTDIVVHREVALPKRGEKEKDKRKKERRGENKEISSLTILISSRMSKLAPSVLDKLQKFLNIYPWFKL